MALKVEVKLTPKQKDIIEKMRNGLYIVREVKKHPYFRVVCTFGERRITNDTFAALKAAGLIEDADWEYTYADKYILTPLGKTIKLNTLKAG